MTIMEELGAVVADKGLFAVLVGVVEGANPALTRASLERFVGVRVGESCETHG